MRSIKRRFDNIAEKNPYKSSYIHFVEAVRGQNFSEQAVRRWFYKLVRQDDYEESERKELLAYLCNF